MRCEEFENRLNAVIDERRRLEWDAELREHCDECAECSQLAADYCDLLDGFYALNIPDAPADMALRVMAEMRPQVLPGTGTASSRRWPLAAAALATAAGLLIALVPSLRTPTPAVVPAKMANEIARPGLFGISTAPAARFRSLSELPLVPGLLSRAASTGPGSYENLARETGNGLATVVPYVPAFGTVGFTGAISVFAVNESSWAAPVLEGFKPVADSFVETVDVFLRAFPTAESTSRS